MVCTGLHGVRDDLAVRGSTETFAPSADLGNKLAVRNRVEPTSIPLGCPGGPSHYASVPAARRPLLNSVRYTRSVTPASQFRICGASRRPTQSSRTCRRRRATNTQTRREPRRQHAFRSIIIERAPPSESAKLSPRGIARLPCSASGTSMSRPIRHHSCFGGICDPKRGDLALDSATAIAFISDICGSCRNSAREHINPPAVPTAPRRTPTLSHPRPRRLPCAVVRPTPRPQRSRPCARRGGTARRRPRGSAP